MTKTVHELRNEIRVAAGRFERETAAAFTKEDLRDISEAVGHEVDTAGRLPPKVEMRAGIREAVGLAEAGDATAGEGAFRKDELEALLDTVAGV